jgi:hypothetical protein
MFRTNYLILFLFLSGCAGSMLNPILPTIEQYNQYKKKADDYSKSSGIKHYTSLVCPKSDPEGNGKVCSFANDTTQLEANNLAFNKCNTRYPDCVVIKEDDKWVFSQEQNQKQTKQTEMNRYITQCEYIGFKRNTEKMGECVLKISKTEKQLVDVQVNNAGGSGDSVANLILLQESLKLLNPPTQPNRNVRCTFNNVGGIGAVNCF